MPGNSALSDAESPAEHPCSLPELREPEQLTSFGFLEDSESPEDVVYGLGQLLTKVKTVFSSTAATKETEGRGNSGVLADIPEDDSGAARRSSIHGYNRGASLGIERGNSGSGHVTDMKPAVGRSVSTSAHLLSTARTTQLGHGKEDTPVSGVTPSTKFPSTRSTAVSKTGNSRLSGFSACSRMFPGSFKSVAPAPPVTSTAPLHAMSYHTSANSLSDTHREVDIHSTVNDSRFGMTSSLQEDALGHLGLFREPTSDYRLPWTSIPGFPLSRDLLADDSQSIRSISSLKQGSEVSAEQGYGDSSSTSLQTSAEAFRRLTMKGGAAQSKEWWMPDASAKECSACSSTFTVARRRHHCRCCGQIFCAKCASNLLPGSKLGLTEVVRVCNFCAQMLRDYDLVRDGITQRDVPKAPRHGDGRVTADLISAPLEAAVENAPQGKFAANALFGASALGCGMSSRDSSGSVLHRFSSSEDLEISEADGLRVQPSAAEQLASGAAVDRSDAPAPFRKCLADDDQVLADSTATDVPQGTNLEDGLEESPRIGQDHGLHDAHPSSIAFPSLETKGDSTTSMSGARTIFDEARARLASDATLSHENRARLVSEAAIRAFRRSRLRSRVTMDDIRQESPGGLRDDTAVEGRPNSRLAGTALGEICPRGLQYLRRLCSQSLAGASIPDTEKWLSVLLPLTTKVVQHIQPLAHAHGKNMGIMRYVKIKRIPGGDIDDCHLASGYTCSRNVAAKSMLRRLPLRNSRVILLAFPLTAIKSEGHYVSLETLSASEKEYTRILVSRILSLRPNLLVIKDQVSRLALEMLDEAGVVVVSKVPESSMSAIARVTQGEVVTSADRLALRPRLGRCGKFAVDTYHSELWPAKRRSFLRFSGTAKQLGCSFILRGGSQEVLGRVKAILELLLLAAHNLRLEQSMSAAQLSLLPRPRELPVEAEERPDAGSNILEIREMLPGGVDSTVLSALKEHESTLLSISMHVKIPPPYPLIKLYNEALVLKHLELEIDAEKAYVNAAGKSSEEGSPPRRASSITTATEEAQTEKALSIADQHEPEMPVCVIAPEPSRHNTLPDQVLDEMGDVASRVAEVLPSEDELNLQARLALASSRHDLGAKYIVESLQERSRCTPFAHQNLVVLQSFVSSATMRPCEGPQIAQMEFYGIGDSTVAEHLNSKCAMSSQLCKAKNCSLQRILHFDSCVHNDARVQIFCERFVCPIAGQENSILTWEYCKLCEAATPVSVVHEEAKAYSWAKFLEAHFYTLRAAAECRHESLTDRIRYFAYKNLAFRIHVERIFPLDIVVPGLQLFVRPDIQSKLKAEETLNLARRTDRYFHSVAARLKALEHELTLGREGLGNVSRYGPDLLEICQTASDGRKEVNDLMVSVVKDSNPADTLCLNRIRRKLQEIVVKIDRLFSALERLALPKERDVRRLTTSHLSRLFLEKEAMEAAGLGEDTASILPAAHEVDEPIVAEGEGAASTQHESSISMLARVADSAALGLPPYLGLPADGYTPASSGIATPKSVTCQNSALSSQKTSARSSAAPTPVSEASTAVVAPESSPETHGEVCKDQRENLAHYTAEDQVEDESECNSSLKEQLRPPLLKPRPRKAAAPSEISRLERDARSIAGMITDSSCTEGGTDAPKGFLASQNSSGDAKTIQKQLRTRGVHKASFRDQSYQSSEDTHRILLDSETAQGCRPTSPVVGNSLVPSERRQFSQTSHLRGQRAFSGAGSTLRNPPSSYRAPVPKATGRSVSRTSESESDAGTLQGPRGLGLASLRVNMAKPGLVRRVSAKSDSGTESTTPGRGVPRRIVSPAPNTGQRGTTSIRSQTAAIRVPVPSSNTRGRVSTIAKHFNRINREAEREREKQRRAMALRARRALPISASTARVAEYTSVSAAVESDESSSDDDHRDENQNGTKRSHSEDDGEEADSEPEDGADTADASKAVLTSSDRIEARSQVSTTVTAAAGDLSESHSQLTAGANEQPGSRSTEQTEAAATVEHALPPMLKEDIPPVSTSESREKGSLLKTISSLWASRQGASLPLLEYPLTNEQHLFADSSILLRDDEPSSLIAFTLVSAQYQERLRSLRASRDVSAESCADADASMVSWNLVDIGDSDAQVERSLRRPEGVHLRFDFVSGASRFHCRILFAEQFDALRRCCSCQDFLITSLARCVKWGSSGGKSGMTFLKTRDDRLVLKQLSSAELTSFSTFAPHYFSHMADCLMHGKPTTLAKIFGLFRISMRNQATGRACKMDVLVMENLFYGSQCTRIFDLKGSMRNRYVSPTGAPGEVLLDENLVEISFQQPLYIREASKALLQQALKHDSDFLADMNIMDYSVIVGVDTSDEQNRELVVGIIDFLRSYTWDKRVETFVKEQSSLLGAAKSELPTVITPKQYANRFLKFLDSILLLSPDSWYKK